MHSDTSQANIQREIDKVYSYSQKWRFEFNSSKSTVIVFGKDTCPDMNIKLGGKPINEKHGDTHMGVLLSGNSDMEETFIKERTKKAMRSYFAAESIGSRAIPASPVVLSKLYWTNCISSMVYGLEVVPISGPHMDMLEQTHGSIAKLIQGQSKQTANVVPTASLGWRSIECHIDIMKMMFLWRLLLLPMGNIYKQLTLIRLCYHLYDTAGVHCGPLFDITNVFKKYSLVAMLDMAIKRGEYIEMNRFKSLVKDRVNKLENSRFVITCQLYKSLNLFRQCVPKIAMWPWWNFANANPEFTYKVRIIYRLLVARSCLNSDTASFSGSSPNCNACDNNEVESVDHMLFVCHAFDNVRDHKWNIIENAIPRGMRIELSKMTNKVKTEFLLAGMRVNFTPEWMNIYKAMCDFIYRRREMRK